MTLPETPVLAVSDGETIIIISVGNLMFRIQTLMALSLYSILIGSCGFVKKNNTKGEETESPDILIVQEAAAEAGTIPPESGNHKNQPVAFDNAKGKTVLESEEIPEVEETPEAKVEETPEGETGNSEESSGQELSPGEGAPDSSSEKKCETDWYQIKDPASVACHGSVAKILETLPDWVRPYWTLMRETKSRQPASLANPRAILSSPDGRFFIGLSSEASYDNNIELAVFNDERGNWDFAGITFEATGPVVDRESCTDCHSKPIWDGYPGWRGSFGNGNRDQPGTGLAREELQKLNEIKDQKAGIFAYLTFQDEYTPDYTDINDINYFVIRPNLTGFNGGSENMVGHVMNFAIAKQINNHLARKILNDPDVQNTTIYKLIHDTACVTDNKGGIRTQLATMGYQFSDFFEGYIKKGEPLQAFGGMDIGYGPITMYLAISLLDGMFKKDTTLKSDLPVLYGIFDDPELKIFTSPTTRDFVEHIKSTKLNWAGDFDYSWLKQRYLPMFAYPKNPDYPGNYTSNSPECNKILEKSGP